VTVSNDDDLTSARQALLDRIMQRYRAALELCDAPIHPRPVTNWSMTWDSPDAEAEARRQLWDLLVFDRQHMFPIQTRWYCDTRVEFVAPSELARQIVVNRCFDPNEFSLLDAVLHAEMTFIDVGANVGVYSLFAAKKVGANGRVIAFEPSHRELMALRRNIELNRLANVEVVARAIGDVAGRQIFSLAPDEFAGHNKLGDLALFSTMPTLRLTTDLKNYHWMSLSNGVTVVPVGKASALEVLIYSDSGFEFLLEEIDVLPKVGRTGPWSLDISEEARLELPSRISEEFAGFDVRRYGDLQVTGFDRLELTGKGKAGAAFRCHLDPTFEYTLSIKGRGRPAHPQECYSVDVVTLDSLLLARSKSIDVMKIDVEGAELRVLRGATGVIEKFSPMLIVEVVDETLRTFGATSAEVHDFFTSRGYALFDLVTGTLRPIHRSTRHGSNVIAVPSRLLDTVLALARLDRGAVAVSCAES